MAGKRPNSPSAGPLRAAVTATVNELGLGPENAGLIELAKVLASTIDEMPPDVRQRMLAQTSGSLLATLRELAQPRPVVAAPPGSKLDELRLRRARRAG